MEAKSDSNEVDSGGGSDDIDKSVSEKQPVSAPAGFASRKKSISNGRNDRGMVSFLFTAI